MLPLIYALNNLASLYLQMGQPDRALRIAQDALAGPAGHAHAGTRAKLFYQEAQALKVLGRFPEAEPIFRQALNQMMETGDLDAAARGWSTLGGDYLDFGRYSEAESALDESLRLVRTHELKASRNVLANLAKLRGKQGDPTAAEHLFQEALDAHESVTPLWVVYYERGSFRLETGSNRAALDDFRESRHLAIGMRADIVPVDQSRVSLENYVNRIYEGLVDAGNRFAVATNDKAVLAETFDAAEQDRLWSLRALVLDTNDWRSRLPSRYWDLLARYQATERSLLIEPKPGLEQQAADLQFELQKAEALAGAGTEPGADAPSKHVRTVLDPSAVLFSFSVTDRGSWLWAVDRQNIRVYSLPARAQLQREVTDFTRALQEGRDSTPAGRQLYGSLFGKVPAATLARKKWLLELDGPLYDLPFAALPVGGSDGAGNHQAAFLVERAALQSIPGALLMQRGAVAAKGSFVGIGDPVFNAADPRWRGKAANAAVSTAMTLPRLPNTAAEVLACSRAWGSDSRQLLTGAAANVAAVESALLEIARCHPFRNTRGQRAGRVWLRSDRARPRLTGGHRSDGAKGYRGAPDYGISRCDERMPFCAG